MQLTSGFDSNTGNNTFYFDMVWKLLQAINGTDISNSISKNLTAFNLTGLGKVITYN